MKVKVISLPYIFQVLYVLCLTRPRYQLSVYRAIGPLVFVSDLPFLTYYSHLAFLHISWSNFIFFLWHTWPLFWWRNSKCQKPVTIVFTVSSFAVSNFILSNRCSLDTSLVYNFKEDYTSWYDEGLPEDLQPGVVLSSELMETEGEESGMFTLDVTHKCR